MTTAHDASKGLEGVADLGRAAAAAGRAMGLPYIAASADIGSPEPMRGVDGRPFAESLFTWLDPDLRYWEDRGFALRAAFVHAARTSAEPFYFAGGRFASWRASRAMEAINAQGPIETFGVAGAIIAPAYLPGGVIGAVVWASADVAVDVKVAFDARAEALHALALRFVAAYADAVATDRPSAAVRLTRREIQCLKWAAAGKTDAEIGGIMHISLPTVRFHITNAARKLGAAGRSQAVHRAAAFGYVGAGEPIGSVRLRRPSQIPH
jgi:DNA-binding CsgD family transcriptional regulator